MTSYTLFSAVETFEGTVENGDVLYGCSTRKREGKVITRQIQIAIGCLIKISEELQTVLKRTSQHGPRVPFKMLQHT